MWGPREAHAYAIVVETSVKRESSLDISRQRRVSLAFCDGLLATPQVTCMDVVATLRVGVLATPMSNDRRMQTDISCIFTIHALWPTGTMHDCIARLVYQALVQR